MTVVEQKFSWITARTMSERLDSSYYSRSALANERRISRCPFGSVKLSTLFSVTKLSGFEYTEHFTENELNEGTVPCLTSQNVEDCKVNTHGCLRISETLHRELVRSSLSPEDIILSYTGHYRRAAVIPKFLDAHLGPNVCKLSTIDSCCDAYFFAAFLNGSTGQAALDREKTLSAQPTVNMDRIRSLKVISPREDLQRAIGNKLRKAELLRELANACRRSGENLLLESIPFSKPDVTNRPTWSDSEITGTHRFDAEYYAPTYLALDHFFSDWMKSGRKLDRLERLIGDGGYGVLPSSDHYGQGDLRFLRAQDIDSLLIKEDVELVVPRSYLNQKAITKKDDVLMEVKGEIAGCAVCSSEMVGCLVNGSIYRMTVTDDIDPYYLASFLVSTTGVLQKRRAAANSVISYLSVDFLNDLRIPRLEEEEEVAIASEFRSFVRHTSESRKLVVQAKKDVEALIEGTLVESSLLEDSAKIEQWLEDNPAPEL
ncbi:MAG: hypothetical protein KDN20_16800 [Verrucomicrobiae bacterium]|nr:hypothetical protein [Verrucomicrobiae bacterium]